MRAWPRRSPPWAELQQRAARGLLDRWLDLRHPGWRRRRIPTAAGPPELPPLALAVFDLDGTLVQSRNSWALVTRHFGGRARRARRLHRRYRAGRLSHEALCRAVIGLWTPPPTRAALQQLARGLVLQPGAALLMQTLRRRGVELAILSSGLLPFAREIAARLEIPHVLANRPRYADDGGLVDVELRVSGPRKGELLRQLCASLGTSQRQTLYLGDSADDLSAVRWAGVGVFLDNVNRHKAAADLIAADLRALARLLA